MADTLTLRGNSADDLKVLSALMQDMTIKVGEMAYDPPQNTFAAIGNRYRWEEKKRWFRRRPTRVRAAFHFSSVIAAQVFGFDLKDKELVLALLSVETGTSEHGDDQITLQFSGGASVRLITECVDVVLNDVSEAWEALAEPKHK